MQRIERHLRRKQSNLIIMFRESAISLQPPNDRPKEENQRSVFNLKEGVGEERVRDQLPTLSQLWNQKAPFPASKGRTKNPQQAIPFKLGGLARTW